MAPTSQIILCRHSQAEHNVELDYSIPDAPLTALGKEQSAALAPQIPELQSSVEVIITSALKRTLQSTKLGWGPAVQRLGIRNVICLPQAQECNAYPCDTGSPREVLERDPEINDFNFELLTSDWTSKKGFYAPDARSIANRARWVRQYLRERPEHKIVLVAHGDILRQITATAAHGPSTYGWKNAEVRIFEFDPSSVNTDDCFLFQKEDVAAAGGHDTTSSDMPGIPSQALQSSSFHSEAVMDGQDGRTAESDANSVEADNESAPDELQAATDNAALHSFEKHAVTRDGSIFLENGMIVFPRSDRDPTYLPFNTVLPDSKDTYVNYFHIWPNEAPQSQRWRKSIGKKLALDHFKLPQHLDWQLASFPKDYLFTEQRKGLKGEWRTDLYLFGSSGHRFRSVNEFVPHALWLLTDPSLDTANCICKYCHKGTEWQSLVRGSSVKTESRPGSQQPAEAPTRPGSQQPAEAPMRPEKGQNSLITYGITTQSSPQRPDLPGVPVDSNLDRSNELRNSESRECCQGEGHRRGEFAFLRLSDPVVHREKGETICAITHWPVKILKVYFDVAVSQEPDSSQGKGFSLDGRVTQWRMYDVSLLGTNEFLHVDEKRLIPGLIARLPRGIEKIGVGQFQEHTWIGKGVPELGLENGKPRAPIRHIIAVLYIQIRTVSIMRTTYTMTDAFFRQPAHGPAPRVVTISGSSSTNPSLQDRTNRFLPQEGNTDYMNLDEDDSGARRRQANVGRRQNELSAPADLVDSNQYWQGVYLGIERIWVCDVVRLRLGPGDIRAMMEALALKNDVAEPEDRHQIDLTCSYVMYIKAIYRGAKAKPKATDDKIRVAGDIYKVVKVHKLSTGVPNAEANTNKVIGRYNAVSSFYEPERPFVDAQRKDRGSPKLPWLPEGFTLQRVNRKNVEVVCAIQQLSGRIWPSLVSNVSLYTDCAPWIVDKATLFETIRAQSLKPLDAHEDAEDEIRVRTSVAGLISGTAKAMEVDMSRGLHVNRDLAFIRAREQAEKLVWSHLQRNKQQAPGVRAPSQTGVTSSLGKQRAVK